MERGLSVNNNEVFYSPQSTHDNSPDEIKKAERLRLAKARIGERPWLPLDNASKIFLSTMTSIDTKVFRLTAGLREAVRPALLQKALDLAYEAFPLYHSIIRRGFFWYFVERSALRPKVQKESEIPCAQIYGSSYRGLLFRVLYYENRVHLEVFHALSDGNGAVSFFQLLLIHYLRLCHEADHRPGANVVPHFVVSDSNTDSFAEHFKKQPETKERRKIILPFLHRSKGPKPAPVWHIPGENTTDGRMNIREIHLRTSKALTAARAAGGTLTAWLCAIFMLAIARNIPAKRQNRPRRVVLSVPIDLRQLFPSATSRNFFATVMLEYTFGQNLWPDVPELTAILSRQLKEKSTREAIEPKVRSLVKLEKLLPLRLVPLLVKDVILRLANSFNNLGITASMTNLGRFRLPGAIADDVQEMNVMTSAVRPQFSCMSYDNDLSIVFTSPKKASEIEETFCRILEEQGLEIPFEVTVPAPVPRRQKLRELRRKPEDKSARNVPGQVVRAESSRRSGKTPPYPFVPLGLNLRLAQRVTTWASLLMLLAAFLGNKIWHWGISWTLPMLGLVTLWVTVTGILRNRHNVVWSILWQTFIIASATVCADFFVGWRGWSLSIGLPIIFLSALIASQISLLVSRKALENGILFMMAIGALSLLPLLFILLGLVSPVWPSAVVVALGALCLLLTGILRRRVLNEELGRKWHF